MEFAENRANFFAEGFYAEGILVHRAFAMGNVLHMPPVAAYDALAPYYDVVRAARQQYLTAIESIIAREARGACSLLDVGSGNGVRALNIARSAGIENVVLLEPSAGMRAQCVEKAEYWCCEASQIPDTLLRFDLILCLWNTLGHLKDTSERLTVLARLKALLSRSGKIFVDVNHRYNARSYGRTKTLLRALRDIFSPSETNGDVTASWQAGDERICTHGHVFTHRELLRIFNDAGLRVNSRWVVDYESGVQRRSSFSGNLLYQLT